MSTVKVVAPTATPALIFAYNKKRKGVAISNASSTVTAYLGFESDVSAATGFPLNPGMQWNDDVSKNAFYAVTAGSTGDVRAIEIVD
jgi:hypothetical protein